MFAGSHKTVITPPPGVELAGLGYYLERVWTTVRDDLTAGALVLEDGPVSAAIIAVDLMYIDAEFVDRIRTGVSAATGISRENILVAASHSHNSPNAAVVRGVGERNDAYLAWVVEQAVGSAAAAWRERERVALSAGSVRLEGLAYNRTRENGPLDPLMTVLRADRQDGSTMAVVANYAAHPTAMMEWDRFAVSRDWPGVMSDLIEHAHPGADALFLQGSCGDLNIVPELSADGRWYEAGERAGEAALCAIDSAQPLPDTGLSVRRVPVELPAHRYSRAEVERERNAALRFANSESTEGWREILGRVMVGRPDLFPNRYGGSERKAVDALVKFTLGWTGDILPELETRPTGVSTEAWGLRLGDFAIAANGAELFSHWALELRRCAGVRHLMVAGYANDAISYVADAHDIERATYAAAQSPKYMGRFPFTVEAGERLTEAMRDAIAGEPRE